MTADLPWGAPRGSNHALYGAGPAEAARLRRGGGMMVVPTQDSGPLGAAGGEAALAWDILDERRIVQRSHRPLP